MNGEADSRYLMTPSQHRVEAMRSRAHNPNSRAAWLHDLAAKAQDRQARLSADKARWLAEATKRVPDSGKPVGAS
jgi:hypothetical protein